MASKMGRPSEIKRKGIQFVEALKEGALSITVARQISGVSKSQWRDWKRKGMAGEPVYREWWDEVQLARGNVSLLAEQTIHGAIESGSTADAWRYLRVHGPGEYRDEPEGDAEDTRMTAYVPGPVDEQVAILKRRLMRVAEIADELPPEYAEKILLALKGT